MAKPLLSRRSFVAAIGGAGFLRPISAQTPQASPTVVNRIPKLRIGMATAPDAFAPANAMGMDTMWLSSLVFDSPFRWNAAAAVIPGVFTPSAATGSFVIELQPRSGLFFSDGSIVTSESVVTALRRLQNSRYGWRLQRVDDIAVQPDGSVRIELKRENASILAQLAHPLAGLEGNGVGTGPFSLTSSDGEFATYRRHPLFWQIGRPHIDQLDIVRIADDSQRSTAVATGEIDILPNVPLLDVPMLSSEPTLYLVGGPSNRVCHLQVRLSHPALAQARVRQILSAAIDRGRLVSGATADQAEPTRTLLPQGDWRADVDAVETMSPSDVRAELRTLGVPSDLRLHLLTNDADATLANTAVLLQEQLANCGISLSITLLEGVELQQGRDSGDYDLLVDYSEPWRDPHELLWPLLSSFGPFNWSGYASVEIDVLLNAAISLSDLTFRRARYTRLERIIGRDAPCIPLFRPYVWDAVNIAFPGYQSLPSATSRGMMTILPTRSG